MLIISLAKREKQHQREAYLTQAQWKLEFKHQIATSLAVVVKNCLTVMMNDYKKNTVHFVHTKGTQAKFPAIVNNKQPVVTLFDMGATCSCINYKTFQSIMNNSEIKNDKIMVYKFIVCKNLKTLLILGLDFAEFHMIRFDWNCDRSAYLRFKNKKLISSLQCSPSEKMNRHLKTVRDVRIQPDAINLIESQMNKSITIRNGQEIYQTKANDLLSIEHPSIMIIETLQNCLDTQMASRPVLFVVNTSKKEIIIPKGMTLAYLKETPFEIKQLKRLSTSANVN